MEEDFDEEEDEPEDNILEALLELKEEKLAIQFMGYYHQFLNTELFLFSLRHSN